MSYRQWFYDGAWHDKPRQQHYEFTFEPLALPVVSISFDYEIEEKMRRVAILLNALLCSPFADVREYAEQELKRLTASDEKQS